MIHSYSRIPACVSGDGSSQNSFAQKYLVNSKLTVYTLLMIKTFQLHSLKGNFKDFYAVTVRSNWRIIFSFKGGNAFNVDFIDYH
jgi:plasmid maintenance system killer protein